ncbi:PAS domain S-box protein [Formosa sp. A9]|uniref:PAS domain-containing sensor histidine kinase n=1 Tax=Formosa sp. A9 TaxID=3442641 RepID=UPI003EB86FE0
MPAPTNALVATTDFQNLYLSKHWKNTPLGELKHWPPNLIFSLNLILQSPTPMLLCWGKALIVLYNEACITQGLINDPDFYNLGKPINNTNLDHQLQTCITATYQTQNTECLNLQAVQRPEQKTAYFSFTTQPLFQSANQIDGIMVTAIDQTEMLQAQTHAEHLTKRFNNTIRQAPLGVLIVSSQLIIDVINSKFKNILPHKSDNYIGEHVDIALPNCSIDLKSAIKQVLTSGESFQAPEITITNSIQSKNAPLYYNILAEPLKNENGDITGCIIAATEVSESVITKKQLLESENKFKKFILQSPIPIAVFHGENHVITMANKTMINDIWKKSEAELINKPLTKAFPELKSQKYPQLLDKVFKTGIAYSEKESVAIIENEEGSRKLYFDFDYSPILNSQKNVTGILVTAINVTENILSRQKIEQAETRLRIATEAAQIATWELDLKSSEISHSKKLPLIFGYSENTKLTHETIRKHVNRKDLKNILLPAFEAGLKTGSYFSEVKAYGATGKHLWIRKQGKILYDDNGQPDKIIGTLRDITTERNNQQRLIESEAKFRLLADSMPQKIWTATPDGTLNYYNQTVYDYTGLTKETLNPEHWLDIVHPDDRAENTKLWQQAINTGQDYLFEHRFKRYDGTYRWQLSRAIPQRDDKGNIQRWVGTSTDIQDQKMFLQELERQVHERTKLLEETNIKLENSVEELQRMNEELQSFAYISSHDLQEPLRKIQIFSSRILDLEKDNLSVTGTQYFNRMLNAAERMQTLIKDLLTYSRTNTSVRSFEKTDLNDIINEVKIDLKELLQDNNVTLEVDNLCTAHIIPFQFIQLFNNLISNSIKFAKQDVPPVIKIKSVIDSGATFNRKQLKPQAEYCHIVVSDNGIGFDPKYGEQIFEVFERLHTRTAYEGTGIGLAIVKKIVENHEGYIVADGQENEGATFNIYIPTDKSVFN